MVITLDSTHGHGRLQSMTKPTTPWRPRSAMPTRISSNDWRGRRARVLERDTFTCRDCGTIAFGQEAYVDLIVPVCEGAAKVDDGYYGVYCELCHAENKRRERESWRGSSKAGQP